MTDKVASDDDAMDFRKSSQKKLIDLKEYEKDHFNSLIKQDVQIPPRMFPKAVADSKEKQNMERLRAPAPAGRGGALLIDQINESAQVFEIFTSF